MTITPAIMYWFTRLDQITEAITVVQILSIIAMLIFICIWLYNASYNGDDDDTEVSIPRRITKWSFFIFIVSMTIGLFIPTSKQMAMIYVVPQITESQVVKQDIPELYDLGINALKDWLKENKKENQ